MLQSSSEGQPLVKMNLGIVGFGTVGKHMASLLARGGHTIKIYDKYLSEHQLESNKHDVNRCDLVFVSVPTPVTEDGNCDLSAVFEAVSWISRPICIKSTVPPGTIDNLVASLQKEIVFSPEYIGETPFHSSHYGFVPDLVAFGGERRICELFLEVVRDICGPEPVYFVTDAVTAELAKYMENCFFATKVAFVAQFSLLSKKMGADFVKVREIWLADKRIWRSHSTVIGTLGFGGKCLPKDLSAIIKAAHAIDADAGLLQAVDEFNKRLRSASA